MTERSSSRRTFLAISMLIVVAFGCASGASKVEETTPQTTAGPKLDLGIRLSDGGGSLGHAVAVLVIHPEFGSNVVVRRGIDR